ncbi:helix-turn-helix domain-containing protein [Chitinophagaceae bacterium LWZ2-11]
MTEVEYYFTTSKKWFTDFAESLSVATGDSVKVNNNKYEFSPALAEGKFEFYELEDGLSLLLIDCIFYKELKLKRNQIKSNDYYILHYNLSVAKVITHKESGRVVDIGTDWEDAVLFSSTGKGLEIHPPLNGYFRIVLLIFNRSWGVNHFLKNKNTLGNALHIQEFLDEKPLQFTTNLDLRYLSIAEEMLTINLPSYITPIYLNGSALKLLALFARNTAEEIINEEKLRFDEVIRIMNIKERIEKDIESTLPQLETLAGECLMSKTKFGLLFKYIYGKSFTDMFLELKMQKAAELLLKGVSVSEAGRKIGYNNLGHFAKTFKDYFNTTPKIYQKSSKPVKLR